MSLLGEMAGAVNTTVLGQVLIGLSEAVPLYPVGLLVDNLFYNHDTSMPTRNFQSLGAVRIQNHL